MTTPTTPGEDADGRVEGRVKGGVLRRSAVGVVGGVLILIGIAGLALPGPGLLIMLAGMVVLALEFDWAEQRVDFVRDKALEAAEYGVRTWPRVVASTLGGLSLLVIGTVWIIGPTIPEIWVFGPELPFQGAVTGGALILSGLIALGLLAYSFRRFRKLPGRPG